MSTSELPRPLFSESVEEYARRCAKEPHEVREHWHRELVAAHAEQKARMAKEDATIEEQDGGGGGSQ